MKLLYVKTISAVRTPDYMGRFRWSTEFDVSNKDAEHLSFVLYKNFIKIFLKKDGSLIGIVPLQNIAFFTAHTDVISEAT